jgi:hypothetical protein
VWISTRRALLCRLRLLKIRRCRANGFESTAGRCGFTYKVQGLRQQSPSLCCRADLGRIFGCSCRCARSSIATLLCCGTSTVVGCRSAAHAGASLTSIRSTPSSKPCKRALLQDGASTWWDIRLVSSAPGSCERIEDLRRAERHPCERSPHHQNFARGQQRCAVTTHLRKSEQHGRLVTRTSACPPKCGM